MPEHAPSRQRRVFNQILADSPTPSFRELADRARVETGPHNQPIEHWLRFAEVARRAGDRGLDSGHLEYAFVEYAKASIVVVEVLPQHRDYDKLLTGRQQTDLDVHGQELLDSLAEVKDALLRARAGSSRPSHHGYHGAGPSTGIYQQRGAVDDRRTQASPPMSTPDTRTAASTPEVSRSRNTMKNDLRSQTLRQTVIPPLTIPVRDSTDDRRQEQARAWRQHLEPNAGTHWQHVPWSGPDLTAGFDDNRSWPSASPSPACSPLSAMDSPDSCGTGRLSNAKSVLSVSSMKTTMNQYMGRTLPRRPALVDIYPQQI